MFALNAEEKQVVMNRSYCERMTGCKVCNKNGKFYLMRGDDTLFISTAKTERKAAKELHDKYYELIRLRVMVRDGCACVKCGAFGVSVHHKQFRSHQGTHDKDNLECLCEKCHAHEHGG